jgi:imidazolonepropionase-like amidohydrolase
MSTSRALRALPALLLSAVLGAPLAASEHPSELEADRVPKLRTGGSALIRGATVHTAVGPAAVRDVLVVDGAIAAVGESLEAPEGAVVLEAAGAHLAPGAVDCHSHLAIEGGVNEGTVSISAEVRIADALQADDLGLWRALAGGTTTARLLHGSANAIGGQDEVIHLRWERRADELRAEGGPQGIKLALGENPKRANWGEQSERFPNTRMGVEGVLERAFLRAAEQRRLLRSHAEALARGEDPAPPRPDLRLQALVDVLEGEILVHSHCYRADGILMLLRCAERHGFEIATLQHVLEGYKVAWEMAEAGVGGSTFADWWGYKVEAYDAIPENAALMERAGVLASVNSDSDEVVRHMYLEAAKSVRHAGMDPVAALRLVTLNPAAQLGLGERIGSIEVGKRADLALLDGPPLSAFSKVLWTMVGGEIEFQRRDAFGLDGEPPAPRALAEEDPERPEAVPAEGEMLAITGGTVHTVTAGTLQDAVVLVRGGRIAAVGHDVPIPAGTRVISAAGKHVSPGLVALDTSLGLREIGAVRATVDTAEIGGDQPDLRVSTSLNADSEHFPVTLAGGVTRAQVVPDGGGPLRGQSAVVRLVGDTWEELVIRDRDMLHVTFPRVPSAGRPEAAERARDAIHALERSFEEAREHARLVLEHERAGTPAPRHDPRLEALAPYATGAARVALHADDAETILAAVRFAREQGLDSVLYGAREAWKVVDVLAEEKIPVAVGPVLALPSSPFDPYDAPYANAAVLWRAGVPTAILSADESNTRNLGIFAGVASAYGLPREEALRAVTWMPAKLLGLEHELGSLRAGKLADLVITDGHPLDATTRVEMILVDGRVVEPESRQTRLRDHYRERLERLQAGG